MGKGCGLSKISGARRTGLAEKEEGGVRVGEFGRCLIASEILVQVSGGGSVQSSLSMRATWCCGGMWESMVTAKR